MTEEQKQRSPVRLALAWGGCVGLFYGAMDLGGIVRAGGPMVFPRVTPHLPYIAAVLLGYAAVHGLALALWTSVLAMAVRMRGRTLSDERWAKLGFGLFAGFAAWLTAMNLADVCIERDIRRDLQAGRIGHALKGSSVLLWTLGLAGAAGWAAARGFARLERTRQAALGLVAARWVRRLLAVVAAAAIAALLFAALSKTAMVRYAAWRWPCNVLLITVDTLRPDYLSCYGSSKVNTEHIDALAKGGVVFEAAISQAPWTRPSVASLLTGRYPSVHGAGQTMVARGRLQDPMHGVRRSVPLLAERLQAAHFTTQAFLSNSHLRAEFGFGRGFDSFFHFDHGMGTKERKRYMRSYERRVLLNGLWRLVRLHPILYVTDKMSPPPVGRPKPNALTASAEDIVTTASEWLGQFGDGRPERFFLWLHFMDPHEYANYHAVPQGAAGAACPFTIRVFTKEEDRDRAPVEYHERAYRDNVAYTDWALGQLFGRLKTLGLHDKTLIILTADHGEEFSEHGGMRHAHTLHDEVIRVPLILSLPGGLPAGARVQKQARLVDIVPTVLEVLGMRAPRDLDGQSVLAMLPPGAEEGEREAFSESMLFGTEEQKSLRTSRFKVIYTFETKRIKLYDLRADPQERRNVAPHMVPVASRMLKRMDAWVKANKEAAGAADRAGDTVVVSHEKEIMERLKALGYVTDDR